MNERLEMADEEVIRVLKKFGTVEKEPFHTFRVRIRNFWGNWLRGRGNPSILVELIDNGISFSPIVSLSFGLGSKIRKVSFRRAEAKAGEIKRAVQQFLRQKEEELKGK